MNQLDELREQLIAEAIEAERVAATCPMSDRYHQGRIDAYTMAITLLDNLNDPDED